MDVHRVPSDFAQWWTAFLRQWKFYLRTSRFLGLLLFVLIVTVAFTGVTVYLHDSGASGADYMYGAAGELGTFGIIIGAIIGGDAIAMDFGSGTGYFMLVLPVKRLVILLGRYAAAFVVTLVLIVVFLAVPLLGGIYFWGVTGIPWVGLGESFLLAALYGLAVLSTAFFFSALFRSPAVSMVATILILFLGFLIIDGVVGASLGYEPWFSLLYAGSVVGLPLVAQAHHTVQHTPIGAGRTITTHVWYPYTWEGTLILLAYFVIFLVLSAVVYQYKESKG
jgi:ABC-2 type transport system permease protein